MNKKYIILIWLIIAVLLLQTILMVKVVNRVNNIQDFVGIVNNG